MIEKNIISIGSDSMYNKEAAGKKIQKCRRQMGITQQILGDDIGFSRTKVSNLETARNDICMTDAVLLCEYLNVSLDTIFYNKEFSTADFLIVSEKYFKNEKISKKERNVTLKILIDNYLDL